MKIMKAIGGGVLGVLFILIIGFVLYKVPLIVGIPFMIVLALIMGYFGVKIKVILDKKKILDEAVTKIENQKYKMKTQEIQSATIGPQLERTPEKPKGWGVKDEVPMPETPQEVVQEIVPEEVQEEASKDLKVQVEGMDSLVTIETYEPEERVVKKKVVKPKKVVKKKKKKRVKRVVKVIEPEEEYEEEEEEVE